MATAHDNFRPKISHITQQVGAKSPVKKTLLSLAFACSSAFAQQGAMPQMPDLEAMFFQQFDTDNDKRVTKAEFIKPTEAQFDHMDKNGDGVLDEAEIAAFNQEMQQQMKEMQQQMQQNMPNR